MDVKPYANPEAKVDDESTNKLVLPKGPLHLWTSSNTFFASRRGASERAKKGAQWSARAKPSSVKQADASSSRASKKTSTRVPIFGGSEAPGRTASRSIPEFRFLEGALFALISGSVHSPLVRV